MYSMYRIGIIQYVCIIMLTGNNIILDQFLHSHPLVMVPVIITLMVATTRSFIAVCPLVIFFQSYVTDFFVYLVS